MRPLDGDDRPQSRWDRVNAAFNTPAKIGAAIFLAYFLGVFLVLVFFLSHDNDWRQHLESIVLGMLLIFGPIFVVIAWAAQRSLRTTKCISKKARH